MAEEVRRIVAEFAAHDNSSSGVNGFIGNLDKSVKAVDRLIAETQKQSQIASSIKIAGFDPDQLNKLESQFATAGNLQDRFYAATHTNLEVALKDHDGYFADLRIKWQDNESMLTMINQTETAERKKILTDYGKSTTSTLSTLRSAMRAGFATYIIRSFVDTGTNMLEAKRKGESMFDAFLAGLPIINRLSESASKLARELSGLAAVEEMTAKSGNISEKYNKTYESLSRIIKLQSAGDNRFALQAQYDYEDRLKEIDALDKEADSIRKYNQAIDDTIKKGKVTGVGFGGGKNYSAYSKNEIDALNSQKIVIENFNALRQKAKSEYNVNLLAGAGKEAKVETKEVVDVTRDALTQMRTMDYLTRNERIMNLEAYKAAHVDVMADVVGNETEAGKLIRQEIENLRNSRQDAMKLYATELKNDMEDSALYTSEKYAEAARAIEGSMSNAFNVMENRSASASERIAGFIENVASSMSRVYSDMAARGLMNLGMNLFSGGASNAATGSGSYGGTGGGGPTGGASRSMIGHSGGMGYELPFNGYVPTSLLTNAPRLHTGTKELYAKIRKDEGVFTPEQMKNLGPVGNSNSGVNITHNHYYDIKSLDSADTSRWFNRHQRELAATNKQAKNNNYSRR